MAAAWERGDRQVQRVSKRGRTGKREKGTERGNRGSTSFTKHADGEQTHGHSAQSAVWGFRARSSHGTKTKNVRDRRRRGQSKKCLKVHLHIWTRRQNGSDLILKQPNEAESEWPSCFFCACSSCYHFRLVAYLRWDICFEWILPRLNILFSSSTFL